jgi:hypothetical protein
MKYTDVYVKTNVPLEEMSALVGRVVGVDLHLAADDRGIRVYQGLDDDRRFSVQENVWFNDEGSDVGTFQLDIDIDGRDDEGRIAAAKSIFDALKKARIGDLALVDEYDGEMERFTLADSEAAE